MKIIQGEKRFRHALRGRKMSGHSHSIETTRRRQTIECEAICLHQPIEIATISSWKPTYSYNVYREGARLR